MMNKTIDFPDFNDKQEEGIYLVDLSPVIPTGYYEGGTPADYAPTGCYDDFLIPSEGEVWVQSQYYLGLNNDGDDCIDWYDCQYIGCSEKSERFNEWVESLPMVKMEDE